MTFRIFRNSILLAALAAILGGCAGSDPRYSQGLKWVLEQEQDRRTLTAQGFPQYNRD